jgi:hypothetical protein
MIPTIFRVITRCAGRANGAVTVAANWIASTVAITSEYVIAAN